MRTILIFLFFCILLSGCVRTWDEAQHATMNRDTRSNLYNNDINMIYVGVNSDKDEARFKKFYETSIFQKGAQHFAPKELIAQQQCIKLFGFSKPQFLEMIIISKDEKEKFRLFFPRYAKYYCEPK